MIKNEIEILIPTFNEEGNIEKVIKENLKNMKHILENLLLDGNLLITNQIVLPKIFSYR